LWCFVGFLVICNHIIFHIFLLFPLGGLVAFAEIPGWVGFQSKEEKEKKSSAFFGVIPLQWLSFFFLFYSAVQKFSGVRASAHSLAVHVFPYTLFPKNEVYISPLVFGVTLSESAGLLSDPA
jgi:hypothetical protein